MTLLSVISDTELLQKFQAGDNNAFKEIYKRYWAILFRHARKMLENGEEANDVVQDVFVSLWLSGPQLELRASLSSYLYSCVRYKVFGLLDKNKVRTDYLVSLEKFIEEGSFVTDDTLRERELAMVIETEIALLPQKMREVFELSRKHGFSYKQISNQMKISENTVKKQISNALRILRVKLGTIISIFILFF